ncbi:MAG TPA: hypothetical protein VGD31_10165 [Sphingobacteriaceae bacterium]
MKLNVVFLLFLTSTVLAQTPVAYRSFHIEHKEVAWVQVYHEEPVVEKLPQRLYDHLKTKVWIRNIAFEGTDIVAELTDYRPDYKRYGGKFTNTSSIIRTGKFAGKVRVNFKEGKYRVILEGITYTALQASTGSGKATIEQHPVSGTLSDFALNTYRTNFKKRNGLNLDILHSSFKDSFTIKVNQLIDEDW